MADIVSAHYRWVIGGEYVADIVSVRSEKEREDHFTRPGANFPTAVALANQGPELKLLPHSVARASFRAGYSIPLALPKAKSKQ